MHARRLRNHWNYDGYFPFSFKFGSTACYFSVRGASFCVLGMAILSTKPHLGHFGQQISLHHFRYFTYLPLDARSILHVFQGTRGIWWGGLGEGGGGGDNVRWNFHTYSILHVFQGTWWGGLGGGGGGGDNVRWNFHTYIPYYMFSTARRTSLCRFEPCRFEPDQKRMSSDTFGSRLSTC